MVLKLIRLLEKRYPWFESDVISDGTQTTQDSFQLIFVFESDVISDGTQTWPDGQITLARFESDVISDGTQTPE